MSALDFSTQRPSYEHDSQLHFCLLAATLCVHCKVMSSQAYIVCRVHRGVFDSEFYIIVGDVSALVGVNSVQVKQPPEQGKEVQGCVQVYLVREESGRFLVELPGQAVIGGLRTWVDKEAFASPC